MSPQSRFRLQLGKAPRPVTLPSRAPRAKVRAAPAEAASARAVARALAATRGAEALIKRIPALALPDLWLPVATFSVCGKTGTAKYLDLWDTDHFDGFTDMQRDIANCRAWFAADGYTTWDAPQTKTGRVNCCFSAPTAGNYVCNARLQSYAGPAVVQCLIDAFNFGSLPFNGTIDQPHPAALSAGYHHFRIRQQSGSFFFLGLTVWKV